MEIRKVTGGLILCLMTLSVISCNTEEKTATAEVEESAQVFEDTEEITYESITESMEAKQEGTQLESEMNQLIDLADLFDDNVFPTACAENVFGKGNYLIDDKLIATVSMSSTFTLDGFRAPLNVCVQAVCKPKDYEEENIISGKVYFIENINGQAYEIIEQYTIDGNWKEKIEELGISYQEQDFLIDGTIQKLKFTLDAPELSYVYLVKFDTAVKGIISVKTVN